MSSLQHANVLPAWRGDNLSCGYGSSAIRAGNAHCGTLQGTSGQSPSCREKYNEALVARITDYFEQTIRINREAFGING